MAGNFYSWDNNDLLLNVRVQPRASRNELADADENALKIRLTTAPVDGKANNDLKKFLGKLFGVAPSRIQLLSGETHRNKRLRIPAPTKLPKLINEKP